MNQIKQNLKDIEIKNKNYLMMPKMNFQCSNTQKMNLIDH